MTANANPSTAESGQRRVPGPLAVFRPGVFLALLLLAMLAFAASAPAAVDHFYAGSSFGPDGTAGSSFGRPGSIAVDQSGGFAYVAEIEAGRIEKFTTAGAPSDFSATPGSNAIEGVGFRNGTAESQLAVAPGDGSIYATKGNSILAFKPSGEPLEFTAGTNPGTNEISGFGELLGVAVDDDGNIYAGDYGNGGVVNVYASTGEFLTSFPSSEAAGIAVDSTGAVYVNRWHLEVTKYVPDSLPVSATTAYSEQGVVVSEPTYAISIDRKSDDLYAVVRADRISQFSSAGIKIGTFAASGSGSIIESDGVAVIESTNEVLASSRGGARQVSIFGPGVIVPTVETAEAFEVTGSSAVLRGSVNPSDIPVDECYFEIGNTAGAYDQVTPCEDPDAGEIGNGDAPVEVSAPTSDLSAGTEYHFRLVATNVNGPAYGEDLAFLTKGPTIARTEVINAFVNEATVEAEINPGGSPTNVIVEYGETASYGQVTPQQPVGADEEMHELRTRLGDLAPNTIYHYRFVASNEDGTAKGPDRVFRTAITGVGTGLSCPNDALRTGPALRLPDCRSYELVSPVDKNGGDISSLVDISGNPASLNQSSVDGNKLTYTSAQGFGDAQGVPYVSQYIASRSTAGWRSHSINSPQGISAQPVGQRVDLEFRLFSEDLCDSVLVNATDAPLASGVPSGVPNLYRRSNCGTESLRALTTMAHGQDEPQVEGLSGDGACVVFRAPFVGLYESCGAGSVQRIGVLPNGDPEPEAIAGGTIFGQTQIRQSVVQHNVSDDGSRVYWLTSNRTLYLRINAMQEQSSIGESGECAEPAKACTVPVSAESGVVFHGATPDGQEAIYSSGTNYYRFDLASGSSTFLFSALSDLTGFVGMSDDATRLYVISEDSLGSQGSPGKPNLFFVDLNISAPDRFKLVGTLESQDIKTIGRYLLSGQAYQRTSRVTDDGRYLVFTTRASLTGYDNRDRVTGEADSELFRFDALGNSGAGRLDCISCNPTGQRPIGRAIGVDGFPSLENRFAGFVPPFTTAFHASRAITEDGGKVFFNSFDPLLPIDTNGREDVYQWSSPGAGSCDVDSDAYSEPNGGCLSLISSGESASDSYFVDADPVGRNVFFATGSSLVQKDPGQFDIYVAREGGGFAAPPGPPSPCEGEACQGPFVPPTDLTPGSESFQGPGNAARRKCGKGKVRKNGRCVRRKKSRHRPANTNHSKKAGRTSADKGGSR